MKTPCPQQLIAVLLAATTLLSACASLTMRPTAPYVSLADMKIVDIGLFEQRYRLGLRFQNPNDFTLPIRGMSYELHINGKEFARGVSKQSVSIPAFGETLVNVEVVSNLARVLTQLNDLGIRRNENLRYSLYGDITLGNVTGKIPFEYEGHIGFPEGATQGSFQPSPR